MTLWWVLDHSWCLNLSRAFCMCRILLKGIHHCTWLSGLKWTISSTICTVLSAARELHLLLPASYPSWFVAIFVCLDSCCVGKQLLVNCPSTSHKIWLVRASTLQEDCKVSLGLFLPLKTWHEADQEMSHSGNTQLPHISFLLLAPSEFPSRFALLSLSFPWTPKEPQSSRLPFFFLFYIAIITHLKLLLRSCLKTGWMSGTCGSLSIALPAVWTGPITISHTNVLH